MELAYIHLFIVCVIVVMAAADTAKEVSDRLRDLATCSSYTSCTACNQDDDCVYLDGDCGTYYSTTLKYTNVNDLQSSYYCHNSPSTGFLYLDSGGDKSELYSYSNASVSTFAYCEWRIIASGENKIDVEISKLQEQHEEIYLYSNSNSGVNYMYAKDFANCNGESRDFTIDEATFIRIKVKMLSDDSNYIISVSEEQDEEDWLAFILIMVFGSLVIFGIIACISVIFYKIIKWEKKDQRPRGTPEQLAKVEFIKRCLSVMVSGKFEQLQVPYDQDNCVVCLEDFKPEDDVNITNECNHAFHWRCLNIWFRNIRCDRDLTCPHCSKIITDRVPGSTILDPANLHLSEDDNYAPALSVVRFISRSQSDISGRARCRTNPDDSMSVS